MAVFNVSDHPLPEIEGLGVRIVDAENTDTLLDPVQHNAS